MTLATRQLPTCLDHTITVFSDDHIGDNIQRHGLHEKETLLVLCELLGRLRAPVVLDIGANIGNHTLAFATRATRVHAFEPLPDAFSLLNSNVQNNLLSNVALHAVALSDRDDVATLYQAPLHNVGMSSFDPRQGEFTAIPVTRRCGDHYLAELGVTRVDFMKIDVEGHEPQVLQGLENTIRHDLPLIALEWNNAAAIARFDGIPIWEFLNGAYSFFSLGTTHDRTVWEHSRFAFLQRKWRRLLPRQAIFHGFDRDRCYDCILLVPRGQESLLDGLAPLAN